MECPYGEHDLRWDDFYGTGRPESFYGTAGNGIHYPSTWKKLGDIYKCTDDECEGFDLHFYTKSDGELVEGYPC